MCGVRKNHRGSGIEDSGCRHVECKRRTAQELGIEGVERCVDAPMQAIQPTRRHAEIKPHDKQHHERTDGPPPGAHH
jgi:hypothetical protein